MKLRTFFAFVLFLFVSFLHAQEGFYYQAAIRNTDGSPIRNTTVTLQLSILENETIRFEENHELETNSNGIIHTTISSGEIITGEWNAIDWSQSLSLKETILLNEVVITESIRPLLKAPRAYVADKALSLAASSIHAAHVVNETLSNDHIASNAQIAFDKLAISREDIEDLGISSIVYSAGENITISESGEISAIDTNTEYTAGSNITINEDGVISATDTDTNTTYTAGTNISIDDQNVISALDIDTNTTYTLAFEGAMLTLTDSEGNSTELDLSGLDTDTNTTYSAGANISISDIGEISALDTNTEYIAGSNINITEDGVISATDTDTTYSAGSNITISEDGVISATDTDTNTTYTAGTNISIDDENVISSVDTDTNTTYTLTFEGATLTFTDSESNATSFDLSSLDTDTNTTYTAGANITINENGEISSVDTNTEYTAGSNVSIDANNIISSIDTDTTYSAGTNITIDGDNTISATDTDTNTTYTLSFTGSVLTLTDSDGAAKDIDLSGLDTDTNTTYTAGTNIAIDDNNIISATDTDTTYSAGSGIEITNETISIDATVVTSNFQGSITANAFVGDGSGLTNLSIPNDAITNSKIADASITSDKIDSSVDYLSGINSNTLVDFTNGSETVFTNSGASGNFPLFLTGSSSVTDTNTTSITLPQGYSVRANTMIFITKTTLENAGADIISENDTENNAINVKATSNGAPYPLTITFNFMIVNFDY